MRALLRKITNESTVSRMLSEQEYRLDILFYASCLVATLVSLFCAIFAIFLDYWVFAYIDILIFSFSLASFFLSKKGFRITSTLLFVLSFYFIFIFICLFLDVPNSHFPRTLHHYFLVYGIGVFLRLNNAHVVMRYGLALLCLLTYLFFASTNYYIDTPYKFSNYMTSGLMYAVFNGVLITIAFAASGMLFYIKRLLQLDYHAVIADLRKALFQKQFELYYQPQSHFNTIIGVEALVRWHHPTKGMIMPNDFIPLAEKSGLILPLGYWILAEACEQLVIWSRNEHSCHLTISVNVSSQEFNQKDYVTQVLKIIDRTGANPSLLKLELTEGLLVHDIEDVVQKMTMLRAHGICISLDDFGTGYASLKYLKRMPLDQIKIDRAFVQDILHNKQDQSIALVLIDLARQMNLEIIAEGVETIEQQKFLSDIGCDRIQGYLLSPPLKISDINKQLGIS